VEKEQKGACSDKIQTPNLTTNEGKAQQVKGLLACGRIWLAKKDHGDVKRPSGTGGSNPQDGPQSKKGFESVREEPQKTRKTNVEIMGNARKKVVGSWGRKRQEKQTRLIF